MNWIEEIDDMLAEIENTVKGREGDVITKVRGIINDHRKEIDNSELIDQLLLEEILHHSYALRKIIIDKEQLRSIDATQERVEKILYKEYL